MIDASPSPGFRALDQNKERTFRSSLAHIRRLQERVERAWCEPSIEVRRFEASDLSWAVHLAHRAYAPGLVLPCVDTLREHAAARKLGFDDGRLLFKALRDGVLIGVCGLHRYVWGPADIAWLSWFFVAPEARCSSAALHMFNELIHVSRTLRLRALYVETPNGGAEYASVYRYLPRLGFTQVASLSNYYADGTDLLIFVLPLSTQVRT